MCVDKNLGQNNDINYQYSSESSEKSYLIHVGDPINDSFWTV